MNDSQSPYPTVKFTCYNGHVVRYVGRGWTTKNHVFSCDGCKTIHYGSEVVIEIIQSSPTTLNSLCVFDEAHTCPDNPLVRECPECNHSSTPTARKQE